MDDGSVMGVRLVLWWHLGGIVGRGDVAHGRVRGRDAQADGVSAGQDAEGLASRACHALCRTLNNPTSKYGFF